MPNGNEIKKIARRRVSSVFISPSETARDIHEKVDDYLRAGTRLIWLVYPDNNTVMEYRAPEQARVLTINENLEGGDVLPGFRYPLKQLFR